jgi:hypothetical protein
MVLAIEDGPTLTHASEDRGSRRGGKAWRGRFCGPAAPYRKRLAETFQISNIGAPLPAMGGEQQLRT